MKEYICRIYICLFVVIMSPTCTSGGGYVQIKLETYWSRENKDTNGHCCQRPSSTVRPCSPCDTYFHIYLGTLNDTSMNISQIVMTPTYTTSSNVTFNNNIGSFRNPMKLFFQRFSTSLYLFVQVVQNGSSVHVSDRPLELLQYHVGQGEPGKFSSTPTYTKKDINGTTAVLDFNYRIQCDQYYYGNCDVYCKPCPGQYNCSDHGDKIYESGWSGQVCVRAATTSGRPSTTPSTQYTTSGSPSTTPTTQYTSGRPSTTSTAQYFSHGSNPTNLTLSSTAPLTSNPNPSGLVGASNSTVGQLGPVTVRQSSTTVTSTGLIAGGSVGAAILLAALIIIAVWLKKRSKRSVSDESTSSNNPRVKSG